MTPFRFDAIACLLLMAAAAGCDTDTATSAQIDDAYPAAPDAGAGAHARISVYEAWWVTTHFPEPVAAGESSRQQRTAPNIGYAYALLAPGFDPNFDTEPTTLVPVRSRKPLQSTRGETLHIVVSDDSFIGYCAAGSTLSDTDAQLIVGSILPGPFRGLAYDPKTCTTRPVGDASVASEDDAG